jgi:hypothetical protein
MERNRALREHLIYNLQFVVARQLRILKSKKRAIFLIFANISNMREKTLDIPDIRNIFEKKESILKNKKKDVEFNVNMLSTMKKSDV